ncbi:MAG: cyclin family protein [Nanoarchaeota archaeon]
MTYIPFKKQVSFFLNNILQDLEVGSEIRQKSAEFFEKIENSYISRPSTIASSIIFIAGSVYGIDLIKELSQVSTTRPTLIKWIQILDKEISEKNASGQKIQNNLL